MKLLWGILLFACAQVVAWFQSNGGILGGKVEENYLLMAFICGPFVAMSFAYGTKLLYSEMDSLWSIRFLTFGLGYMVFIPLTWYFLGEEILTWKNAISFVLCVLLMSVQFFMK
jgi:hypothetical protein